MKILAIDPGYERLGIAVMERNGKIDSLIYSDCFFTEKSLPHAERLSAIGIELDRIIDEYEPKALSVETLFFSKNTKTAMKVAEARGVILHAAARRGLNIYEFSPISIKVAVTGYGRSDKNQIMSMIPRLVKINKKIKYDDEFDAIAAGITFFATIK